MDLQLTRLSEIPCADIIALHTDPRVMRHLPLATGGFDESACRTWVEAKERQWEVNGYGPWAILVDGAFAGWGGLQEENGEPDLALVLSPAYWGFGRAVYDEVVKIAFERMGFDSVTALLPTSRVRSKGLQRLGFQRDGELRISGVGFCRYRLMAPGKNTGDKA